jgi:hypothetical protein
MSVKARGGYLMAKNGGIILTDGDQLTEEDIERMVVMAARINPDLTLLDPIGLFMSELERVRQGASPKNGETGSKPTLVGLTGGKS